MLSTKCFVALRQTKKVKVMFKFKAPFDDKEQGLRKENN